MMISSLASTEEIKRHCVCTRARLCENHVAVFNEAIKYRVYFMTAH